MPRSLSPPSPPAPDLPLASVLEQGWDAPPPIGEGNSQPALALSTSPPGFLPGSPIQDADLDAAAGSATPHFVSMRGAVLAPPTLSHPSTGGGPFPGPAIRVLPASAAIPRGTFSLRGVLMHVFVSYRVVTEGMVDCIDLVSLLHSRPVGAPRCTSRTLRPLALMPAGPDGNGLAEQNLSTPQPSIPYPGSAGDGNGLAELVAREIISISTDTKNNLSIPRHGWWDPSFLSRPQGEQYCFVRAWRQPAHACFRGIAPSLVPAVGA
jgi:hypothetical protein